MPSLGRRLRRWASNVSRTLLPARQPPHIVARGTAVGLFVAFTPTLGIQIPIVAALWGALRKRWRFHLPVAIAWTFATNVVTAPPIYYAFVVTGRAMLGRWDELRGFETFSSRLDATLPADGGFWQTVWWGLIDTLDVFGVPMLVGCVPWAIIAGTIGYVVALKSMERLRRSRRRRIKRALG